MDDQLRQGDRVYTPRFGRGEVLTAEWIGDYQKLTIRFENGQEITLRDPAALHLEKIEEAVRSRVAPAPIQEADDEDAASEDEMDREEVRRLLVEAFEEVHGKVDARMGERWVGGKMVLQPGRAGTQSKEVPLDKFFQKIVRVRDQLRILEQKINTNPALSDADRIVLHQYITRCYGTLTTFNVLFRDEEDRFVGEGGGA